MTYTEPSEPTSMPSWASRPTAGRSNVVPDIGSFLSRTSSNRRPLSVSSANRTVPHGVQRMPSSAVHVGSWAMTLASHVCRSTTETAPPAG